MAVIAFVPVLPSHGLPLAAGGAEELYMRQVTTRYQTAQQQSTAARERWAISDASALIVQLSICCLTIVEADMLSAADREPLTSLHHAEQRQRVSAHCMLHEMLTTNVHVAIWC